MPKEKITSLETFFERGCGRCSKFDTPQCKVFKWQKELAMLREIANDSLLVEELKWSQPCYTHQGKNVVILSAFENYCAFNFISGGLLNNDLGLLVKPGENSQDGRQMRFTSIKDIDANRSAILATLLEAKEQSMLPSLPKEKPTLEIPQELKDKMDENEALRTAFEALTPGRQRSYCIHISSAKQAKTRISRIEKCYPKMLTGKGFNEY